MAKRPNPIICHSGGDNGAARLARDVPSWTGAGGRAAKAGVKWREREQSLLSPLLKAGEIVDFWLFTPPEKRL